MAKTATRAGIVLWEKPLQNMRSTLATELIEIYPAHVVNAWMGHSEAVAMAHYRQTGKAIDKFYEQAAGQQSEKVQDFAHEPAGMEYRGVEVGKTDIIASPCISIACNSIPNSLQDNNLGQVTRRGLEPRTREPKSLVLPITPPGSRPILTRFPFLSRDLARCSALSAHR